MTPEDVLALCKDKGIKVVDFRFMDFPGLWKHFTIPASRLDADIFENGLGFDGSSIRGWKSINESDMLITAKKLINIQHAVSNIYDETLAALLRFCAYFESIENFGGSLLVAQAVDYIKENYASASLADIAEKLYVSPTYLSRIFAAEMKDTFSRYVQKYRVKISKKLLLDPQYKIYNIAKMVGYSDVAHFSKAFKQVEGISPMKFKNISNQGGRITGQEK